MCAVQGPEPFQLGFREETVSNRKQKVSWDTVKAAGVDL
jgi:hypothetical protein